MVGSLTNSLTNGTLLAFFMPREGAALWIFILGSIFIGFLFLFLLTQVPAKFRKPIIIGVTFVSGWFYFLEFMIPRSNETMPLRRQLIAAEQAVWKAQTSLHRAIAISKERGSNNPAVAERIERAQGYAGSAVPQIGRAIEAVKEPLSRANTKVRDAELARGRLGAVSNDLPRDKLWSIEVADGRLVRAGDKYARLERAEAGLQSALEAARDAESILAAGAEADVALAAAKLGKADSGLRLAQSATEENFLTRYKEPVFQVSLVIGAFALGLGVFGLASMHAKTVLRRRPGWLNSLAFWIAMVVMLLAGLIKKYGVPAASGVRLSTGVYDTLFYGALAALGATMFSLVAFYIVSAAYRAFRMRTTESALMMLAAFLVMLSLVPVGVWLTGGLPAAGFWSAFRLENIGDWIMKFPNTAAQRGMAFGIGVGMLAMAIRIWLSLERGSYFDKQV
jgi:hypothetical protein